MHYKIFSFTLFFRLLMGFFSAIVSICFAYTIGERYFFDHLFYQKSVTHGYYIKGKNIGLKDFGLRAKYLLALEQSIDNKRPINDAVSNLHSETPNEYYIIVLGDSYVWGTGVRNEERFVVLLEKMLNKIRPTRVIDLGNPGDNFFINYAKYLLSIKYLSHANLSIWGMVNNDLLFNNTTRTSKMFDGLSLRLDDGCLGPHIDDFYVNTLVTEGDRRSQGAQYSNLVQLSLDPSSQNYCAYLHLASLLPKNNAIYVKLDDVLWQNDNSDRLADPLVERNLTILSPRIYYEKKYTSKGETLVERNSRLRVSTLEAHPSRFAHNVYAELLFQEITTSPRWGFTN